MSEKLFEASPAGFQPPAAKSLQTEAAVSRQAQEVQAAMVIAKKFPRDENSAYARIMKACQRKSLAEAAVYEYPRGGTKVSGPSIRMAEVLAQSWGNIDFGVVELEQRDGESSVMAYAWDLETNTRQTKIFQVRHERKAGREIKRLDDPRDVYEMVANQGARRVRACIMGVIPGDVIDDAVRECERTMEKGEKEPLSDRIRKMVATFASEYNVSQAMIEARFGHKADAISESEIVSLKKIYRSLKDGMASVEDFFSKTSRFESTSKPSEPAPSEKPRGKPQAKGLAEALKAASAPVSVEDVKAYCADTDKDYDEAEISKSLKLWVMGVLNWKEAKEK